MFFYLLHHTINALPFTSEWSESRKNCLTLFLGGNLYVIFFVFLEWIVKNSTGGNFWAQAFRNFYFWFILVDAFSMAIVYKSYWGRSIFREIVEEPALNDSTPVFGRDDQDDIITPSYKPTVIITQLSAPVATQPSETTVEELDDDDDDGEDHPTISA